MTQKAGAFNVIGGNQAIVEYQSGTVWVNIPGVQSVVEAVNTPDSTALDALNAAQANLTAAAQAGDWTVTMTGRLPQSQDVVDLRAAERGQVSTKFRITTPGRKLLPAPAVAPAAATTTTAAGITAAISATDGEVTLAGAGNFTPGTTQLQGVTFKLGTDYYTVFEHDAANKIYIKPDQVAANVVATVFEAGYLGEIYIFDAIVAQAFAANIQAGGQNPYGAGTTLVVRPSVRPTPQPTSTTQAAFIAAPASVLPWPGQIAA